MVSQVTKNTTTYRTANVCVVLILAYSILCIAALLRAKHAVCSTTSPGIDLSIALPLPTILTVGVRGYLIFRQRSKKIQSISPSAASPRLDSACATCVQFLVFLWMILGCLNLIVALRAPVCLDKPLSAWQGNLVEQNWRYGPSCRLHRAVVALSVLMAVFISTLSFFDSIDRKQSYRTPHFFHCYCTCLSRKTDNSHSSRPSISSSRSGSEVDKDDRLFLVPERRPSRMEHEQWLQRRNSLSSQKAIFPHRYQHVDPRSRYGTHSCAQSMRYSTTLRSVSEGACLDLSDRNTSLTSSESSSSLSRATRPPTLASSRSRANSSPEKPSGSVRQNSSPTPPSKVPPVPLPAIPAPTWSPALHHTPLSADPTIRALSTGVGNRASLSHSRSSPALLANVEANKPTTPSASSKKEVSPSPPPRPPPQTSGPPGPSPPPGPALPPPPPPPTLPPPPNPPPAIASRAPNHSIPPRRITPPNPTPTTTTTPTTHNCGPLRPNHLRRPSPIRHRPYLNPYQHRHHHHHHNHQQGQGYTLPHSHSPHPQHQYQYQYQRVWTHGVGAGAGAGAVGAGRNPSVYSASSYGTDRTRGSSAYAGAGPGGSLAVVRA